MSGGIRVLADILDRSRLDDVTGCWVWAKAVNFSCGSPVPMAGVTRGVLGMAQSVSMPAARVAWLLAGKRLPAGHVVYRCCGNKLCVNPAHLAAALRGEALTKMAADGHGRGRPERAVVGRLNCRALPKATVQQVEQRLALGEMRKDIAVALGISRNVVTTIRKGQHAHQRQVVRGASVFSWGGGALHAAR